MTEDDTFAALKRCSLEELDELMSQLDNKFGDRLIDLDEYYNQAHPLVLRNGWSLNEYREKGQFYIDRRDSKLR